MKKCIVGISVIALVTILTIASIIIRNSKKVSVNDGVEDFTKVVDIGSDAPEVAQDIISSEVVEESQVQEEIASNIYDFTEVQQDLKSDTMDALVHYTSTEIDLISYEQLPEDIQEDIVFGFESEDDIIFVYSAAIKYFGSNLVFTESDKLPGYIYENYINCIYDVNGVPYQFVYRIGQDIYIREYR